MATACRGRCSRWRGTKAAIGGEAVVNPDPLVCQMDCGLRFTAAMRPIAACVPRQRLQDISAFKICSVGDNYLALMAQVEDTFSSFSR